MCNTILFLLLQISQSSTHHGLGAGEMVMLAIILAILASIVLKNQTSNKASDNKQTSSETHTKTHSAKSSISFCPQCGSRMVDGTRFCSNCGYDTSLYGQSRSVDKSFEKELSKNEIDKIKDVYNPKTVWDDTTENDSNSGTINDISTTNNLMELKKLLDSGVITQEDYNNKKKQLLDKI